MNAKIYNMGQCPAKSLLGSFSSFFFHKPLSNYMYSYASKVGLSIIKLLGTEFIYSYPFISMRALLFLFARHTVHILLIFVKTLTSLVFSSQIAISTCLYIRPIKRWDTKLFLCFVELSSSSFIFACSWKAIAFH